jgi:hypothetical protein
MEWEVTYVCGPIEALTLFRSESGELFRLSPIPFVADQSFEDLPYMALLEPIHKEKCQGQSGAT